MSHAYTEDHLVEQPASGLFADLGWTTVSSSEEAFGVTGTLLRESKAEVVLVSRLRAALERLNPALPPWMNRPQTCSPAAWGQVALRPPDGVS